MLVSSDFQDIPFVVTVFLQCISDKHRPVVYCTVNITQFVLFFYSVYSFLLFLITGQTVALFSLKSIMFSRVPVVFLSVLDAHVAGNSFIVQFATAALKSPRKIRSESKTEV